MDVIIQEYVNELKRRLGLWKKQEKISYKEFKENIEKRDMIMHNMLLAIQSAIDIGNELIKKNNLEIPSSYKDIFAILGKNKIINKDLTKQLEFLAGFRNVLVHLYWKIDLKRVYLVLKRKRKILEKFYKLIRKK